MPTVSIQNQLGWYEWEVYRLQRTSSALPASVKSITNSYSVTDDDWFIFSDGSGGAIVTIPVATQRAGQEYVIKRTYEGGNATVVTDGGTFILTLRSKDDGVAVVSDGTAWRKVYEVLTPYPENRVTLYDDFLSLNGNTAGTDVVSSHSWRTAGATPSLAAIDGHVRVDGDGTTQGRLELTRAGTFNLIADPDVADAQLRVRAAQRGTSTGTRRFGFSATVLTGDAVGVYFRHANAGNYICVVRNGSGEDTSDSGVAAADGVFHTFRIWMVGGNIARFYIDDALVATVTGLTTYPTGTPLGISFGAGGTGTSTGLTVDYVYYEATRTS